DPREYIVQYRESDMDFIARLMEDEGLFYFFQHDEDGHCMIIADGPSGHKENPGTSEFVFREMSGLEPESEHFFQVSDAREVRSGRVTLDDFNFTRPPLELLSSANGTQFAALEISDYPGDYQTQADGARYAQLRLEEQTWPRRVLHMKSTIRVLLAGFRFRVKEHPTESLNAEYVALRVTHRGVQHASAEQEIADAPPQTYQTDITALPSDVPFRAPRRTPRPFVHGSQTAIVVGPKSEEIHTDEYG